MGSWYAVLLFNHNYYLLLTYANTREDTLLLSDDRLQPSAGIHVHNQD